MLVRGVRNALLIVGPLLILVFVGIRFYDETLLQVPFHGHWTDDGLVIHSEDQHSRGVQDSLSITPPSSSESSFENDKLRTVDPFKYNEIFAISTSNKKYFDIDFGDHQAYNPNILPHRTKPDTWIVVAQLHDMTVDKSVWFAQLFCDAQFVGNKLKCIKSPLLLPIAATETDKCTDNLSHFVYNIGPHDARAFYGPQHPYTIYGSQSSYSCFGMWMQDLRTLYDWGYEHYEMNQFRKGTELQRPAPFGRMEKNWFMFWDTDENFYVHYDIAPARAFARIDPETGKLAGPDLAPFTKDADSKCLAKYMPQLAPENESNHQGSNSLSITMCKRSDPSCQPNDSNTFIMHVFQHKTYYSYHAAYDPYIVLFQRNAPFALHAISSKPMWMHGREPTIQAAKDKGMLDRLPENNRDMNGAEMLYITSISWKKQGMKYHGYIDDELFIGFGVEDYKSGAVDVVAGDLLGDLGLCADA